jgi:para-aminobenzoate synthetase component I
MRQTPIPYHRDSTALFEHIADEPWSVFLDSGRPGAITGRYDIIAARPWATVVTRQGVTEVRHANGAFLRHTENPMTVLRAQLGTPKPVTGLPFAGGAIGYLAYDLGSRLDPALPAHRCDSGWPDMAFGLYSWAVIVDHECARAYLVSSSGESLDESEWARLVDLFARPMTTGGARAYAVTTAIRRHLSKRAYHAAFDRLMAYIQAGDCYQANLTQRFSVGVEGDPWAAYQALRRISPTPYAAYLNLPFGQILSASPERFLEARSGQVVTQPIKGTRPRGATPDLDALLARELAISEKDRAENLMIVDLLRNDLGKVCRAGSITVTDLFAVATYANVHHLVSAIKGRLGAGEDSLSLLAAAFPGGSITGAPKRRAMEIIAELEPEPRGLYCGSIGYLADHGDMDSNIAIRTLVWRDGHAEFAAGGGIVADSHAEAEYRECLDKAAPMFRLFDDRAS